MTVRTQPDAIIRSLESVNSRIDKEKILSSAIEQELEEFFQGLRYALDPLYTFGIKQVPEKQKDQGQGLPWIVFVDLVKKLYNREFTGHTARGAVTLAMDIATKQQWNDWYRRILIKDLRCGVSDKTVNKVCTKHHRTDWKIPVFSCQLATDGSKHESKMTGNKLIELKLDGVRVLTIVYPNKKVVQYSRNGKELVNFEKIKQQLSELSQTGFDEPVVLDGEVMSSSFQDLMKQIYRKENVEADDAVLYLFDIIPLSEFTTGVSKKQQEQRSRDLHDWYAANQQELPNIRVLDQKIIDFDTQQGKSEFNNINDQAIKNGYEGLMIKDPCSLYKTKRTDSWLKIKPFIEVTLEVVDLEPGTGRNRDRLGALVCKGLDSDKYIEVNVGSGFSDLERDDIWNEREKVKGRLVEVRADAISQNQDGSYSLRFPRFKTFRGLDLHEKI